MRCEREHADVGDLARHGRNDLVRRLLRAGEHLGHGLPLGVALEQALESERLEEHDPAA